MRGVVLIALLSITAAVEAVAQTPVAIDWQARTLADISAIDHTTRAVHIGMIDPKHPGLERDWTAAVAEAKRGAATVKDRGGWAASLRRLVNVLRDTHARVLIGAAKPPPPIRWTGDAVDYVGGEFFLRPEGTKVGDPDFKIIRCDGQPIAKLAAARLDLNVTDWSVSANRSLASARLLVDSGNPALLPIKSCVVASGEGEREIVFKWRDGTATEISDALRPWQRRYTGPARFELNWQADGSAWVVASSFANSTGNAELRRQMATVRARLLAAPYVVFDVRGNGGGSTQIGRQLAEALWGANSLPEPPPFDRIKRWRVSPQLAASLRKLLNSGTNPERDRFVEAVLPAIEAGLAKGEQLVDDPQSVAFATAAPVARVAAAKTGKVFVLTDGGCSSACILFVNDVRRMGARQVGDPTDRNTIYAEQWVAELLPSGEAQLLLPSAWFGWAEAELGGGSPDHPWLGKAIDEDGLRAFVASLAG